MMEILGMSPAVLGRVFIDRSWARRSSSRSSGSRGASRNRRSASGLWFLAWPRFG